MKVGIGAVTGTRGGPRTYALSLLRALVDLPGDDAYALLADDPAAAPDIAPLERLRVPLPTKAARPAMEALALPVLARKAGLDVFHATKQTLPMGLGCVGLVSIHDLAPMLFPDTFPKAGGAWLRRSTAAAARRAHCVLTGSETTARDLETVLDVPRSRIAVVHYGVEERFLRPQSPDAIAAARARHDLPERYLLSMGTIQPRKNVDVILDALDALAARGVEVPPLVLAGRTGWMVDEVIRRAEASPHVLFKGVLPEEDLTPILAGAELFLSPSSYEGFGLALAEAMAAGTAVIGGSGSASDEVVADAGILVPPRDVEALADAVADVMGDDPRRESLAVAARERAATFTWEACARGTRDVYRRVLEENS